MPAGVRAGLPDDDLTVLSDDDYSTQARLHLGFLPGLVRGTCRHEDAIHCSEQQPKFTSHAPFHLLSCAAIRRTLKLEQHEELVRAYARFYRMAGLQVTTHAVGFDPAGTRRAPDLTVYTSKGVLLLDVTTWNGMSSTDLTSADPLHGCKSADLTLRTAEAAKMAKYNELQRGNVRVVPLAHTVFGAVGTQCAKVIRFEEVKATVPGMPPDYTKRLSDLLRRAVSCAIARGNARIFAQQSSLLHAIDRRLAEEALIPAINALADARAARAQAELDELHAAGVPQDQARIRVAANALPAVVVPDRPRARASRARLPAPVPAPAQVRVDPPAVPVALAPLAGPIVVSRPAAVRVLVPQADGLADAFASASAARARVLSTGSGCSGRVGEVRH